MSRSTIPAPAHAPGDSLHGFIIDAVTEIPDIKALAYEATHARTGAQLLHVHCNDEENLFSVGFRTPPSDSTGIAHILEHCVLAGSHKFPVKDAFNELGKRTLNTFLNAMTWPDRTVYPVCSAVKADYFNLAAVYADLVFDPLITRGTFQREGHHLEVAEAEGEPLTVSGVVFNEMKGVYSDPQQIVGRCISQHLSPDTPYGVDSGGDPAVIPDLTYDQFVEFHRRFYSPSNARFLLYGDVTLDENLAFLEGVLEPFERVEVDSAIPNQPSWEEPRTQEIEYPVGPEDSLEAKTFVLLTWLVDESRDLDASLLMEVATDALFGSAAGPLRKALIDSGLGQDVYPSSAFDTDLRQGVVHFGLRGAETHSAPAIEALILDTLKKTADEGLDPELIEASLHQVAFHTREISPPFPLMVLMRANPPWYYGGDPKDGLSFSSAIERVRAAYAQDPRVFDRLIQQKLLDNPHRLTLVARPSNTLFKAWDDAAEARMTALRAKMSDDEVAAIKANTDALTLEQETPDTPEALATLPRLDPAQIPRAVRTIPTVERACGQTPIFEHEAFSNGIGYIGLTFDVRDLDEADALLLPTLGKATLGMGAAGLDYEAMARRVALRTGGLGSHTNAGRHLGDGSVFETLCVDSKVLRHNASALIDILGDLLTAPDTSDHKRLSDLLKESAARSASALIPRGHIFAYTRAAASLDHTLLRREQWEGVTQIRHLKALTREPVDALAERLAGLQRRLFTRARLSINVAGDPDLIDTLRPLLDQLVNALPEGAAITPAPTPAPTIARDAGIGVAGQVNYVGQVLSVPDIRHEAAPALEMLSQILSSEILYTRLRVQGGAYGGFAFYDSTSGLLPLLSYRDPNLTETFDVYAGLIDHIQALGIDDDTVNASRIGAIGATDRILSPAQQLQAARRRRLLNLSDETRAAFRNGLLTVNADDIARLAVPLVAEALSTAPRAAVGAPERLALANEKLSGALDIITLD